MIDGGYIIICEKCEGAGEDQSYGSDDRLYWHKCHTCKGSGLIHRISTHVDKPWTPAKRTQPAALSQGAEGSGHQSSSEKSI